MKRTSIIAILALILLLQSVVFTTQYEERSSIAGKPSIESMNLTYTPHGAMNITSNADFTSEGWNGSGTINDPYSISGLSFDGKYSLGIVNTTAYFSIEDCYFTSPDSNGLALNLDNITNGNIESCVFERLEYGITGYQVQDSVITENEMENVTYGISGLIFDNMTITYNEIKDVTYGILLSMCTNSKIASNNIHDCFWGGIVLMGVGSGTCISNNEIYDVIDIDFLNGGLTISGEGYLVEGNTIHNATYGIGAQLWGGVIDTIFRNNEIYDCHQGFHFGNSEDSEISNNLVYDVNFGVSLYDCDDFNITANVLDCSFLGISMSASLHCEVIDNDFLNGSLKIEGFAPSHYRHTIEGNSLQDGEIGYFLDEENIEINSVTYRQLILVNCTNVIVRDQMLHEGYNGIQIAFSSDCEIINSTIFDTFAWGVHFINTHGCSITESKIHHNGHGHYHAGGLNLQVANSTRILNNMIYSNNASGIELIHSSNTFIHNNLISNNTYFGIQITGQCSDNRIYGNAIGWNTQGNAFDGGSDNSWDDGTSGNMWSDYDRTVSDTYEIEGDAESIDNHPQEFNKWRLELPSSMGIIPVEILVISGVGVVSVILVLMLILRKKDIV